MDSPVAATPNSVGWYILEGFPWWPVYICDQFKLRPNLHLLGDGHSKILKKARDFSKNYVVVYYFGSHDFSLVSLSKPVLRPWDCPQKESFLKGHPQHLVKKKSMMDDLQVAIQEVEDYLSQPEDIRLPQHMVPSDLDPTLEPPPPELVPQEMDVDEDANDEEDGEGGEDGAALDEEDLDASGDSDADKKKKAAKKTSKDKKEKRKKKAESKTKKSKSKKTVSSPKDPKDPKSKKVKKSSSKSKDHTSDAKKRKKSSGEAAGEGGEVGSPSKVAKTALDTDVKSEPVIIEPETADVPGKKASADDLSGEALSAVLEKEIRWILVNCQFEEMTTKTVRKLLEDRLNMDLRHHKPEIKEGVARVIASMEEGDAMDPVYAATGDSAEPFDSEEPVAKIESVAAAAVTPDTALTKKTEHQGSGSEAVHVDGADDSQAMEQQLADAEKDLTLALDLEPKIVDVLTSLESISAVEKNVLTASSLLPKLVQLRAHRASAISKLVASLAEKWSVEDLIPAPKPIQEEDILELKAKLEDPEMSHDEVLACLNQLSEMPLKISHLRKTGIALVVSKLRQHGNDKVSTKANNLRHAWIKLMDKEKATSSNADSLKTLENLNKILEQRGEKADGSGVDESVQSAQLAALERLQSMSLLTQEIIESKIGVAVSKLRKSSNEKIANAAINLRKKWKAEAKAA